MYKLRGRELACCCLTIALLPAACCPKGGNGRATAVDDTRPTAGGLSPSTQPVINEREVWVVKDQDRCDKFRFDEKTGYILDCKYHRKQYVVQATIIKADPHPRLGPDDTEVGSVCFALRPQDKIPEHPDLRVIRYILDDGQCTKGRVMQVGQAWEITFTDHGGLLDLCPVDPTYINFDSFFQEWDAQGELPATRPADAQSKQGAAPTTLPAINDREVWRVNEQDRYESFDFDRETLELTVYKYRGKRIVLYGTIVKVEPHSTWASSSAGVNFAYFQLLAADAIPQHPDKHIVKFAFASDFEPSDFFQVGQIWQLTLRDDGGLLDLCPAKPKYLWDGSIFQREMAEAQWRHIVRTVAPADKP